MTNDELNARLEALKAELAAIGSELTEARATMQRMAGGNKDDQKKAEAAAARILVLEARDKSIREAITATESTIAEQAARIKSKEYKDAQKEIEDLARYFAETADATYNELGLILQRMQEAAAKYDRYTNLVRTYCIDLSRDAIRGKLADRHFQYLTHVWRQLALENQRMQHAGETVNGKRL